MLLEFVLSHLYPPIHPVIHSDRRESMLYDYGAIRRHSESAGSAELRPQPSGPRGECRQVSPGLPVMGKARSQAATSPPCV